MNSINGGIVTNLMFRNYRDCFDFTSDCINVVCAGHSKIVDNSVTKATKENIAAALNEFLGSINVGDPYEDVTEELKKCINTIDNLGRKEQNKDENDDIDQIIELAEANQTNTTVERQNPHKGFASRGPFGVGEPDSKTTIVKETSFLERIIISPSNYNQELKNVFLNNISLRYGFLINDERVCNLSAFLMMPEREFALNDIGFTSDDIRVVLAEDSKKDDPDITEKIKEDIAVALNTFRVVIAENKGNPNMDVSRELEECGRTIDSLKPKATNTL